MTRKTAWLASTMAVVAEIGCSGGSSGSSSGTTGNVGTGSTSGSSGAPDVTINWEESAMIAVATTIAFNPIPAGLPINP